MIGIILVILGAVVLGYQGFTYTGEGADGGLVRLGQWNGHPVWVPPATGGIAVVLGSLLIAVNEKRDL